MKQIDASAERRMPGAAGSTQKLQKVLAEAGLGSRRQMEEWIRAGRVTVNGAAARLGSRVQVRDVIRVDDRPLEKRTHAARLPRVLIYHKPEGEIVSRDDPQGRPSVFERLPATRGAKWLALGRLDFNTGGLLLFTTSGELANRMLHPRYEMEREYAVRIRGRVTPADMQKLLAGIRLEDGRVRFDSITEQGGEGANRWYHIVLREGRNRVVRRVFETLGLTVSRLMRIRFGPVALPQRLTRGHYIELPRQEVQQLLRAVGLRSDATPYETAETQRKTRIKAQ